MYVLGSMSHTAHLCLYWAVCPIQHTYVRTGYCVPYRHLPLSSVTQSIYPLKVHEEREGTTYRCSHRAPDWLAQTHQHVFSNREFTTTVTEDIAMARLAIQGCSTMQIGTRKPAARGIPRKLYTVAHKKFSRIFHTVRRDNSMAATTSKRLS